MKWSFLALVVAGLAATPNASRETAFAKSAPIARARSLELDTRYVPPPGDPLEHHTAGFAKIMCSAVFITGLDPDFAAENVGYFTGPYAERAKVGKPIIDRINAELRAIVSGDETRARIAAQGGEPLIATPEEYAADIEREQAKWGRLIKRLGLRVE